MLKKINRILNIISGTTIGVFLGYGIYVYWHYRAYPGLYAMQSAPWYTGIIVYGIYTMVALLVLFLIKRIIRRQLKQQ